MNGLYSYLELSKKTTHQSLRSQCVTVFLYKQKLVVFDMYKCALKTSMVLYRQNQLLHLIYYFYL